MIDIDVGGDEGRGKNSQVMEGPVTFWCKLLMLTPQGHTQNVVFPGIRYQEETERVRWKGPKLEKSMKYE